jgi:hypothetical protein
MGSISFAVTWTSWSTIPDTGTKFNSLSGPFVTDSVCSVCALPVTNTSSKLYVVAERTSDQTIWLNSTDGTQQTWDGWREVQGNVHTAYPPSVSFYGTELGGQLDVIAVGINGGADHGIYINTLHLVSQTWSGWKQIPGFLTNNGVAIVDRHLFAREWLYGNPASAIYQNDYNQTSGWTGWKPVPGGLKTTAQTCAYPDHAGLTLLSVGPGWGQIYRNHTDFSQWFGWTPLGSYFTNVKVGGPMDPYAAFYNAASTHLIFGVTITGSVPIPGNLLTDSGLESCSFLVAETEFTAPNRTTYYYDTYKTLLFAKGLVDHRLYFASYLSYYSYSDVLH